MRTKGGCKAAFDYTEGVLAVSWAEEVSLAARVYPFRRFLAQRWWFLLLCVPKLYRAAYYGAADGLAVMLVFALILGVWYLIALHRIRWLARGLKELQEQKGESVLLEYGNIKSDR